MATTNFVDRVTPINASWLNDVDAATYEGAGVFTSAGTGAVARTVQAKLRESVSVRDYGAVGDGVADDTAALTNALAYAFANNKELRIDIPVYVSEITVATGTGAVRCIGVGKILPITGVSQPDIFASQLLTFQAGVADSEFDLSFDMRGFSKSACLIEGDDNRIPYCRIENIQAATGRVNQLFGLAVSGDDVEIGRIEGINLNSVSTMNSGGTTLGVIQYAQNTTVDHIHSVAGFCAYLGNGVNTTINSIFSEGCTDNVIYSIAGSQNFVCNEVVARNCIDEVVVFSGDDSGGTIVNENPYVGRLVAYNCQRGVGLLKTSNPRVGIIDWYVDDPLINSGSPLYIRSSQTTQLNRITVGELRVQGIWRSGAPIWTLDNGGVQQLDIGRITARLTYDDATKATITTLAFSSAPITQMVIGAVDIQVQDVTGLLTAADVFRFNLPTGLSKISTIQSVYLSNDDGLHGVSLVNPVQEWLYIGGTPTVRGDLDPPALRNTDAGQVTRVFGSGAAPTQGTWKRGDIVWNQFPSNNGHAGWVCVTAGTPGTWVQFGPVGTFASGVWSPTLTIVTNLDSASVVGCQYIQIGQVVTVSGTLLLDATATGSITVRMTPPVASAFTGSSQCSGVATSSDGLIDGVVSAETTSDDLQLVANAGTASARNVSFAATYRVL